MRPMPAGMDSQRRAMLLQRGWAGPAGLAERPEEAGAQDCRRAARAQRRRRCSAPGSLPGEREDQKYPLHRPPSRPFSREEAAEARQNWLEAADLRTTVDSPDEIASEWSRTRIRRRDGLL